MAVVTQLGATVFTSVDGVKTATATPAVDDLIVIVAGHTTNTATTTPTDDQSGTYTLITQANRNAAADTLSFFVRTALITSAVSTIFTHAPGTTSGGGFGMLKVTGMTKTGATAALQSGVINAAATGTPAPILPAVPQAGNPVVSAIMNVSNPATTAARAGYTDRGADGYGTPTTGLKIISIDSGETSATITWGASSTGHCSMAIELDASGAAGGNIIRVSLSGGMQEGGGGMRG